MRESLRVDRGIEDEGAELSDSFWLSSAEVVLELIYLCVVRRSGFS